MRSAKFLSLLLLPACFSGYTPDIFSDRISGLEGSSSSSSCGEKCDNTCEDSKDYGDCLTECINDCVGEKDSCPRPPSKCSSCSETEPVKAALCEPCKKSEDCAGKGSLCLGATAELVGHCGQQCVVDCDCPETYECRGVIDPKTGHYDTTLGRQCVPESKQCPQCRADADCEGGNICEAGACVAACTDDASCTDGLRCFEDGRCAQDCCEDKDCGDAGVCAEGRCTKK